MEWHQCWLIFAACVLSTLYTSGSARSAYDGGICIRVRQVNRTTLTYCRGKKDCKRVCCKGWSLDPDSRRLHCIKMDPNDPASFGAMDTTRDLGSAEDYITARRVRDELRKSGTLQMNVRQSREAPSASENTPGRLSAKNDRSGLEAASTGGPDTNITLSPSQPGSVSVPNAVNGTGRSADSSANKTPGPQLGSQNDSSVRAAKNDGKAVTGTVQSNQSNSTRLAAPASNDNNHSLLNGTIASEHLSSSTTVRSAQLSATSSPDAIHTSTEKPNPPLTSGRRQESSNNEPASPSGQSTSISSQDQGQPHVPPVVTNPESKNSTGNSSAIVHSEAGSQTPAKTDRDDRLRNNSQISRPEGPVDKSVATSPNASITVTTTAVPQPPVSVTSPTDAPKVQAGLPTSAPSDPTPTTASPVVATSSKSSEPESPVGQSSKSASTNSHVVTAHEHIDQDTSSAKHSTQAPQLALSPDELARGEHKETELPTSALQSTNVPPIPTNNTNLTTTETPIAARTSTNATGSGALPPQVVNPTHPVQNETRNNTVPTGSSVHGTTTSTTTTTVSSISHGGTTPTSVANTTAVLPPQHPNDVAGNVTHEHNVTRITNSSSRNTTQVASAGNYSVVTGQQGGASAANTTEKKDNVTIAANCTEKVTDVVICGDVNCSHPESTYSCRDSYDTVPVAKPQASTPPPVAKPLGEEPHGGSSVPSGSSASKTASEVTISLLVVAAVAFVAALLYWRRRRRDRSYINYGTCEPNLHFSNPVYNLEALMEQTSLVKLQDAAAMEDGELGASDLEEVTQRK